MENPVTHSSQPTLSALESPVFELDAVLFSLVEKPLLHIYAASRQRLSEAGRN